jgi:DNA-binding NarL/FixJ family response regulator
MIRVVVADDQALVRRGFASILDSLDDLDVVGEAEHGADAVAIAIRERPDVILMDVRMPHMDGLEATRRITSDPDLGGVRIIILTTFDLDEYVHEALCAGASGFLLKDTEPDELIHAVRVVAAGEALIAPKITRRLIEEFARYNEPNRVDTEALAQLTERESEVLAQVARGLSNTEIAEQLFVSQATVKTHVGRLLMKLAARDRAQLVVIAYEAGVVQRGA